MRTTKRCKYQESGCLRWLALRFTLLRSVFLDFCVVHHLDPLALNPPGNQTFYGNLGMVPLHRDLLQFRLS